MDTLDVRPIGIKEAMRRYGISSASTWAEWLQTADIQSFQVGKNRYIYTYQLAKLDAIALERNRPINTTSTENIESFLPEHFQHFKEPKASEVLELVSIMTKALVESAKANALIPDPDENLLRLERIAQNGWQMRSGELAPLLGIKSMPNSPYKARGFLFERNGRWWKVTKEGRGQKAEGKREELT